MDYYTPPTTLFPLPLSHPQIHCDSGELRSGVEYKSLLEMDHCVLAFVIFPSHVFLMETNSAISIFSWSSIASSMFS